MATPRKDPKDYLKRGRPTNYTPELAVEICKIISTHPNGLDKLYKMYDFMPERKVLYEWVMKFPEFRTQYYQARRLQSEVLIESTVDLADNLPVHTDKEGVERIDSGILGRSKLDFEVKRWHAAKMQPKLYGEYKQIEDLQNQNESLMTELRTLKAQLDEKNKKDF